MNECVCGWVFSTSGIAFTIYDNLKEQVAVVRHLEHMNITSIKTIINRSVTVSF